MREQSKLILFAVEQVAYNPLEEKVGQGYIVYVINPRDMEDLKHLKEDNFERVPSLGSTVYTGTLPPQGSYYGVKRELEGEVDGIAITVFNRPAPPQLEHRLRALGLQVQNLNYLPNNENGRNLH